MKLSFTSINKQNMCICVHHETRAKTRKSRDRATNCKILIVCFVFSHLKYCQTSPLFDLFERFYLYLSLILRINMQIHSVSLRFVIWYDLFVCLFSIDSLCEPFYFFFFHFCSFTFFVRQSYQLNDKTKNTILMRPKIQKNKNNIKWDDVFPCCLCMPNVKCSLTTLNLAMNIQSNIPHRCGLSYLKWIIDSTRFVLWAS